MKINSGFRSSLAVFLAGSIAFSGCTSATMIHSSPGAAKIYVDGEPKGYTPYLHSDTKIVGSTTTVKLEKEGYETLNTHFTRTEEADVGAIIGGLFVWVPFLWVMKYKPSRNYELTPAAYQVITVPNSQAQNKAERLREMKKLLDEKVITPAEFEKEKKKILDEQ